MDSKITLMTDDALASLGVTARTLTPKQRLELDERGYLILPGLMGLPDLERLRAAFDCACEREGIPPSGTRHPRGLVEVDPSFARYQTHPALLAAVRHVLGGSFLVVGAVGRDPLPGFGQQGLHVDCVDAGPSTPYQTVTALGLIDDFTDDNGATRLVPGTHRLRRPPPKSFADPASRHPDQVVVTAPAGSVLVFNGHLWHGGTANRSRGHRRAVQCSFRGPGHPLYGAAGSPGFDPVSRPQN